MSEFFRIDMDRYTLSSKEPVPCHVCTKQTMDVLAESIEKGIKICKMCPKHETELALLSFPNFKRRQMRRRRVFAPKEEEILGTDEKRFLARFFYRYGVKEREIKKYCKVMTVKSFISDLKDDFFELWRYKGDPDLFAHIFFAAKVFQPFVRVEVFPIALKEYVEKYREWYRD